MAKVVWSPRSKQSIGRIAAYLVQNFSEDVADRWLEDLMDVVNELAKHPTKGMVIDRQRDIRRWRLDKHNYITYTMLSVGIVVKNILPYKLNKRGF